jgi:hypothetical protein
MVSLPTADGAAFCGRLPWSHRFTYASPRRDHAQIYPSHPVGQPAICLIDACAILRLK